jgi:hypothetical protein
MSSSGIASNDNQNDQNNGDQCKFEVTNLPDQGQQPVCYVYALSHIITRFLVKQYFSNNRAKNDCNEEYIFIFDEDKLNNNVNTVICDGQNRCPKLYCLVYNLLHRKIREIKNREPCPKLLPLIMENIQNLFHIVPGVENLYYNNLICRINREYPNILENNKNYTGKTIIIKNYNSFEYSYFHYIIQCIRYWNGKKEEKRPIDSYCKRMMKGMPLPKGVTVESYVEDILDLLSFVPNNLVKTTSNNYAVFSSYFDEPWVKEFELYGQMYRHLLMFLNSRLLPNMGMNEGTKGFYQQINKSENVNNDFHKSFSKNEFAKNQIILQTNIKIEGSEKDGSNRIFTNMKDAKDSPEPIKTSGHAMVIKYIYINNDNEIWLLIKNTWGTVWGHFNEVWINLKWLQFARVIIIQEQEEEVKAEANQDANILGKRKIDKNPNNNSKKLKKMNANSNEDINEQYVLDEKETIIFSQTTNINKKYFENLKEKTDVCDIKNNCCNNNCGDTTMFIAQINVVPENNVVPEKDFIKPNEINFINIKQGDYNKVTTFSDEMGEDNNKMDESKGGYSKKKTRKMIRKNKNRKSKKVVGGKKLTKRKVRNNKIKTKKQIKKI